MDRRVKERLVGASILVVLIVLIVPELLSGPASAPSTFRLPASAPEPVRNITVDLATSKPARDPAADAAASAAQTAAVRADVATAARGQLDSASGQSTAPSATTPAELRPSLPLETAAPPPTSAATGVKPASGGRAWAVQLGSFASRDNADNLARQVRARGFAVLVSPGGSGSSLRYRVRSSPLADRSAASQAVAKLKALGFAASIVSPGR